jgi:hypothetical protein
MMDDLVFASITSHDLLLGKCPNGHLHIFGFYHQLDGEVDTIAMTLTTKATCEECGCEVKRVDKLAYSKDMVTEGAGI